MTSTDPDCVDLLYSRYQQMKYEIDPEYLFSPLNGHGKVERAVVENYFKVNYTHRFNVGRITRPGNNGFTDLDMGSKNIEIDHPPYKTHAMLWVGDGNAMRKSAGMKCGESLDFAKLINILVGRILSENHFTASSVFWVPRRFYFCAINLRQVDFRFASMWNMALDLSLYSCLGRHDEIKGVFQSK